MVVRPLCFGPFVFGMLITIFYGSYALTLAIHFLDLLFCDFIDPSDLDSRRNAASMMEGYLQ
jgi:hypothetical protein